MAMTLARHPRETKHVGEEAVRLNDARTSRIKRREVADWLSDEQIVALSNLRSDLHNSRTFKVSRRRYARREDSVQVAA
ncbi:hypothetical protein BST65_35285 [Bradyrhizobium canariense]|nr:hypothetical protein BST65_35285 [Bradyrhizobium canariense]OSI26166.1 hypothetical protein BST66_38050 [Bradyrhizobium canariense]OSI37681.1 hypothetical protein BSZ20_38090 [Bradyrhizobium canariense]OSI42427.1 hypothetical protein BST67_37430 [Bradyrhizobium canariense]OSI57268.1 hypothetical protein BSZ15_14375 [Bradyrhizobium canariense]